MARRRGRGGEGASHRCTRELGPAPTLPCGASATARPEGASRRGGTGARSEQRRGHQARGDGGEWEVLARKGDKAQQGQSVEGRWEGGLAGDGVRLSSPVGVAAREDGIIFVADEEAHAVFALQQVRGEGSERGARDEGAIGEAAGSAAESRWELVIVAGGGGPGYARWARPWRAPPRAVRTCAGARRASGGSSRPWGLCAAPAYSAPASGHG